MRTLVLVGGGVESVRGVDVAHALGLWVAVIDADPEAPGLALADEPVLASTYDVAGCIRALDSQPWSGTIAGVTSVATDVPVTVASIADRFRIPGIPLAAARLSGDKILMKQRFAEAGIATPRFWPVTTVADLADALCRSHRDLFVLKPADSRGARGVLLLRRGDDLATSLEESMSFSPSRRCLVEEFESGPQISSESFVTEGWAETPGFSDRNYPPPATGDRHIIEDGGQAPSIATSEQARAAAALAVTAGRALGLVEGVVKGDLVLTDEGPKVIEVALRLSGGWFCTHQIRMHTGVDLVEAAVRTAIGERVERRAVTPDPAGGVAIRYFFPSPGRVVAVPNESDLMAAEGIRHVRIGVTVGDTIAPVANHTMRAGHVIATGDSREQAVARAVGAVRAHPIEVEPLS